MSETVLLRAAAGEHVRLAVVAHAHPGGLFVFDHNWLFAEVVARTAERSMRCHAFLRAEDFAAFGGDLQALLAGASRRAAFEPVDPWVEVAVEAQAGGSEGFGLAVRARDGGSEKAVRLDGRLDRAGVERLREQVAAVAARFPVVP